MGLFDFLKKPDINSGVKDFRSTPDAVLLDVRSPQEYRQGHIPGSKNVDHIKDNLNILDFALTDEEMDEIAKLDKGVRYYHRTDEQLEQFAGWRPAFEEK
jgi:diketogulonate reductase-like aldo/keto reductase